MRWPGLPRGRYGCSTSPPSGLPLLASRSSSGRSRSGCSSSTRRTASRSGAMTSAPTTSSSPTPLGQVGAKATVGLTATATPAVADDIVRRLALRDPVRVTTGFDRPNLSFAVVRCASAADKRRRLVAALGEPDALPAIVYAGTRRASEEVAQLLARALGEEVPAYHAGLPRGGAGRDSGAVHVGRGAGDCRDQRVRHGNRQGEREDRLSRHRAGLARGLLPGGRPSRTGRRAGPLPAVRRAARQGPARVLHPALAARRRRVRARRRTATVGGARRALRRRRR